MKTMLSLLVLLYGAASAATLPKPEDFRFTDVEIHDDNIMWINFQWEQDTGSLNCTQVSEIKADCVLTRFSSGNGGPASSWSQLSIWLYNESLGNLPAQEIFNRAIHLN